VRPSAIPGRHLEPSPRKGLAAASTPNPRRTAQITTETVDLHFYLARNSLTGIRVEEMVKI